MANVVAILGGQWGDEGKGKVVDLLSGRFQYVVRFQGGHNAGHTVKVGDQVYAFHLIPSGVLHPGTSCVLANGVVVHPPTFLEEVRQLEGSGMDVRGRLWVSTRAHLVMPYHSLLDMGREAARGAKKIGTTSRGIGPAYEDRAARIGLRAGDLLNPDRFKEWVRRNVDAKNRLLEALGVETVDADQIIEEYLEYGERMKPFLCDTVPLLHNAIKQGDWVMLEGAQGAMLDVDHGTYPYVTSSNPTIGGAIVGSGVGPRQIGQVLMILKAYSTRVGTGPFPSEQDNEIGDRIRKAGNEFGTTTGRPRRCGWFDLVVARHSARLNDATGIALTLLDVLDGIGELKVCSGYKIDGKVVTDFPADPWVLKTAEPIYETLPGWEKSCSNLRSWDDLPENAKRYIEYLEEKLEVPIVLVSTGPGRAQCIERGSKGFVPPEPSAATETV